MPGVPPTRRVIPSPPVPTRHRTNGRFAILAFAFFAVLFIVGLLFTSSRSMTRVKPPATPAPHVETDGGSSWGDGDHGEASEPAPQQQDSRKPQW